ncbi:NAD(P)-binding protein [Auricularia subglabra TFB-10046 SS5]|nr:NAD(P)-binding protein [Auricularia subglabra TFB-10046 SS5]
MTTNKPLAGKVALVTGSTTGLGLRIYRQLAEFGASVYIAGRSEAAGRAAADEFPNAHYVRMDLSTIKSAREAAHAFLALGLDRLDILVNNAAVLAAQEFGLNDDGVFVHMGVNHFGHFVLTNALLPLLEKTAQLPDADVRIITIGSSSYKFAPKDRRFDSLAAINAGVQAEGTAAKMRRYGVSKLAQCLWARELARRLRAQGSTISSIVVNPGPVASEGALARAADFPAPVRWLFRAITRTPEDAARSVLWAATARDPQKWSGKAVARGTLSGAFGEEPWADLMRDGAWEPLARELWETGERLVEESGRVRG